MNESRKPLLVLMLAIIIAAAYAGFVVINAFLVPPLPKTEASDLPIAPADLPGAVLFGDLTVKKLARRWEESDFKATVDPEVQSQGWFSDLEKMLPIYREDLGALRSVIGTARYVPRDGKEFYDYHGQSRFEKGRAKVRLLLVEFAGQWRVFGVEVSDVKTDSMETEPKSKPGSADGQTTAPKSGSG